MGLRNIFDGLYVDQLIQKNERGESVIYPHGLAGHGYVLPPERVEAVRTKMRRLMLLAVATGLVGSFVVLRIYAAGGHVSPATWVLGAGGSVLALAAVIAMQLRLASGLKKSATEQRRPSIGVFMRNARMARPLWSLWGEVALGAVVLVPGMQDLIAALNTADPTGIGQNALIVFIGGYILWDGAIGILQRRGGRVS